MSLSSSSLVAAQHMISILVPTPSRHIILKPLFSRTDISTYSLPPLCSAARSVSLCCTKGTSFSYSFVAHATLYQYRDGNSIMLLSYNRALALPSFPLTLRLKPFQNPAFLLLLNPFSLTLATSHLFLSHSILLCAYDIY